MNETNPGQEKVLYLKYWHVILMLTAQLLMLGIAWGTITKGQEDMKEEFERRMSVIESKQFVPREEYESFKTDLRDTLTRIESEVIQRNKMENSLQ